MSAPPVRVLLAEDEEHLGAILETFLRGRGHVVTRVRDGRAALAALRIEAFDVALLDVVMPEMDGLEVLRALTGLPVPPEAIVMTGNGTVDTALTAMQLGAYDYVAKPYRMAEVDILVGRAAEKRELRRLSTAARRWTVGASPPDAFLTRMPELRSGLATAERSARGADAGPWIIAGPPGSGRRTLAGWLHARSTRAAHPALFVPVTGHAVADSASLLGAPGGIADEAMGALEAAPQGMVVVESWSRLATPLREVLARASADGHFRRGGEAIVPLETRLCICTDDTSNVPAPLLASASLLVTLPPLHARVVDVRVLAEHFLRSAGAASGRGVMTLGEDAAARLVRYRWPGQVAELRDVIAAAIWRMSGSVMRAADLAMPPLTRDTIDGGQAITEPARASASLAELERRQIAAVLEELGWHRGRAAQRLGISARTLYRRIRQLGLQPKGSPRARTPGTTEVSG